MSVGQASASPAASARAALETVLARLWTDALGVDQVGAEDDFFELGGQSLIAARIADQLATELGIDVEVRTLFEWPTIRELAAVISRDQPAIVAALADLAELPPDLWHRLLDEDRGQAPPPGGAPAGNGIAPLSPAQEQVWIVDQMNPGQPIYNVPFAYDVRGPLDATRLFEALRLLAGRHDSLRTVFQVVDDQPVQVITGQTTIAVEERDLHPAGGEPAPDVDAVIQQVARVPFDTAAGPLVRVHVLRLRPRHHVVVVVFHHIVIDLVSERIFFEELDACYRALGRGGEPELGTPGLQLAEAAARDRDRLSREGHALRRWWAAQLAGAPYLELAPERPRPARPSFAGGFAERMAATAIAEQAGRLARELRSSPFMVHSAALISQLSHHTGIGDIVIGTPADGRTVPGAEAIIGYFVNMLPLRVRCDDDPSGCELVERVRRSTLDAYAHQGLPFAQIAAEADQPRQPGMPPVFAVTSHFKSASQLQLKLAGCQVDDYRWISPLRSRYDLSLDVTARSQGLSISAEYRADLFSPAWVDGFLAEHQRVLEHMITSPSAPISQYQG